jgi:hypothetical protein
MVFFTGRKLIVFNILPKGGKFNHPYFGNYIFLDLKSESVNFHHPIPQATFWVHLDSSMCHNGQKWHENSRTIVFHDYRTHPIRRT